jgi:ubiquinone/menaquinone biosynthesis C-methylase UbiE
MAELKRVLKPGGYLILLEHDNHDDFDNLMLDILHLFYGIFIDKNDKYLKKPDYAQYRNFAEWDFIFSNYNMQYIKSNYLFQEISHDIRYDNIYYTFYKK